MNDKNFKLALKILNNNKIDYWLCFGTLLGIIRDKKLIEWDHDIDIGVFDNKKIKNLIVKLFLKNGFKRKKNFFRNDGLITFSREGGREIDINIHETFIYKKKKMLICKWYIPKNIFCKVIDALSHASSYKSKLSWFINKLKILEKFFLNIKNFLIKKNSFYIKAGYTHPLFLVEKKKSLFFCKSRVQIPKNSNLYLKYIYGSKWKIPQKNFVWYKNKSVLNVI